MQGQQISNSMTINVNTHSATATLLFIMSFVASNYCYAQNNSIGFGSDYKKELWKSIDPSKKSPLQTSKVIELPKKTENVLENKYGNYYSNLKNDNKLDHLLEVTKSPHTLSPTLLIYNGNIPLNQLPAGSTSLMFIGGHFYFVGNSGRNVIPSGVDLSGGGIKKMSQKSKNILTNVFGLEIDDWMTK